MDGGKEDLSTSGHRVGSYQPSITRSDLIVEDQYHSVMVETLIFHKRGSSTELPKT